MSAALPVSPHSMRSTVPSRMRVRAPESPRSRMASAQRLRARTTGLPGRPSYVAARIGELKALLATGIEPNSANHLFAASDAGNAVAVPAMTQRTLARIESIAGLNVCHAELPILCLRRRAVRCGKHQRRAHEGGRKRS